jgi:hypothetical protein
VLGKIKDIVPQPLKEIVKFYYERPICNYFGTKYKKKALLSYIKYPFKQVCFSHTNYFEARAWANVLHEMGYQVDIISHYFKGKCQRTVKMSP